MSCFDRIYDLIIYGAGCAGFAAAQHAAAEGQSVLLLDGRGDLLWEFGRAFAPQSGHCDDAHWQQLVAGTQAAGMQGDNHLGGAAMEVQAAKMLRDSDVDYLFYAWPLKLDIADEKIQGLHLACKEGPRYVRAQRWIDASEQAMLLRLAGNDVAITAEKYMAVAHIRAAAWLDDTNLLKTALPEERVLVYECAGDAPPWRVLPEHLQTLQGSFKRGVLSHASWISLPQYQATEKTRSHITNLFLAVPGLSGNEIKTPADRWRCGLAVAEQSRSEQEIIPLTHGAAENPSLSCDVCVIGIGTGGSHAAIAAGRQGADCIAVEPLPLIGGIGTGGGIHGYYFGVESGQQLELDNAVLEFMAATPGMGNVVGNQAEWGKGRWHYLAKCIVLDRALLAAGVTPLYGNVLADVVCADGRVTEAIITGESGPRRIRAAQFIDGSGDADLCRLAGAELQRGREHDGNFHAFTQSSGRLNTFDDSIMLGGVNFDAGWCDPSSSKSLSDGRLRGICQYEQFIAADAFRTTYIAPAIGLRQGPQVICEEMISFDDLLMAKRYDDEITIAAADYDNHSTDYHWESDEGLFWMWAARNRSQPVACGISYRSIVPRGIKNVLIASRCLGVSQDAHYALRMQRDLARVGEAAGIAAAICSKHNFDTRALDYQNYRTAIEHLFVLPTGEYTAGLFGKHGRLAALEQPSLSERIATGLEKLDLGDGGRPIWWLYRDRAHCEAEVLGRLHSENNKTTWFAACVVALWGDQRAEPRLLEALRNREWGYDEHSDACLRPRMPNWANQDQPLDPKSMKHLVQNWFCALSLLRCCGTEQSITEIEDLVASQPLTLQGRCAVAITVATIAKRHAIDEARLNRLAALLSAGPIPHSSHHPQSHVGWHLQLLQDGEHLPEHEEHQTSEDHRWQLDLAIEKMRAAALVC